MSPSTLHTFIHGREPQPRVRGDLCEWYYRETDNGSDAEMASDLLSRFMPPDQQRRVRLALLDKMEEEFRATGRDVPNWLGRLRGRE